MRYVLYSTRKCVCFALFCQTVAPGGLFGKSHSGRPACQPDRPFSFQPSCGHRVSRLDELLPLKLQDRALSRITGLTLTLPTEVELLFDPTWTAGQKTISAKCFIRPWQR